VLRPFIGTEGGWPSSDGGGGALSRWWLVT
jgi:hypothetical protein